MSDDMSRAAMNQGAKSPTLRRYIYVQAEAPRDDLTMVSFSHVIVAAEHDAEAYDAGRINFLADPTTEARNGYRFLNDYVVAL